MLRAVLRKGVILPLEPLPPDWEEGTALEVAKAAKPQLDIDAWSSFMNQLCADSATEDEEAMRRVIANHRQEAKAQMRRKMGLSG
jgi:hypothetical protein